MCCMICLQFAVCWCLRLLVLVRAAGAGACSISTPSTKRSSHLAHAVHWARFAALVVALSGLALVGVDDGDAGELVG